MKLIKDPLYGYIEVENNYFKIIDSAEFQRLRNIRQTGYASLYPSALHNRFVHSIGVFHLGKKAITNFRRNVETEFKSPQWDIWERTFALACLLHDVGHSPFSHTGEEFYTRSTDFVKVFSELLKSSELDSDIKAQQYGKPHEAMSAIVGYKLLHKLEETGISYGVDYELFVRAIIGVTYHSAHADALILNTIIGMLNGSVIDVDKLDYLIRDSYVTGYSSMAIDVERLLTGYTIATYIGENNVSRKVAAYKKSALSIVENVAYANDLERRWIQCNPTILYDCKLIEIAIRNYNEYMKKTYNSLENYNNVFNEVAISKKGFPKETGIKLRLLSDDDIIQYLKNYDDSEIGEQYFSRNERYKPLWKSETEFNEVVKSEVGTRILREFRSELQAITATPRKAFFMNEEVYREEYNELTSLISANKGKAPSARMEAEKRIVKTYQLFRKFSGVHGLDFKYAIICGNHFESNYKKLAINDIYVDLGDERVIKLGKTLSVQAITATEEEQQGLFYIYTSRKNIEKMKKEGKCLSRLLVQYITSNWDMDVELEN